MRATRNRTAASLAAARKRLATAKIASPVTAQAGVVSLTVGRPGVAQGKLRFGVVVLFNQELRDSRDDLGVGVGHLQLGRPLSGSASTVTGW
jgi:hypothetical protein